MNVLICSAGRRVKVVQYLKREINGNGGKVISADCDRNAPALFFGDVSEIIPRIDEPTYLQTILSLCKKHHITGVLSLIDPELEVHAVNRRQFEEMGVQLILSPLEMVQNSFDKQQTYDYLTSLSIPTIPTHSLIEDVNAALDRQLFNFPLIIKPGKGSASNGIEKVNNQGELNRIISQDDDLIIQPYYKDREFGIDVYIDIVSGNLIDLFIKEKLQMRSGETDKSISVHNNQIELLVQDFIEKTDFVGPIDIDCFEYNGQYYISEINPRFGGGYPHAQEMGCNFMKYIVKNLQGNENEVYDGYRYEDDYVMMKYDDMVISR